MSNEALLAELKRVFPNALPRVTPKKPFDAYEVNRKIGQQEVIRFVESYIEQLKGGH